MPDSTPRRGPAAPLMALAAVLLLALALLAGRYLWLAGTPANAPAGADSVTIATNVAYPGTCPVLAAQAKGYFARESIHATVLSRSSGKAAMEAVLDGQAQLGTVADIPIMFAGMNDKPVKVIATIFRTDRDHGVVGRRDRGVLDPASLKGKRVGVTLNTSGHFALNALINRHGLAPAEVSMLNFKQDELSGALMRGDVDAVASWDPLLDKLLAQLGGNGVAFFGQDIYESLYNVAGTQAYVLQHPALMRRVLRALDAGAHFCAEEPVAAQTMMAASANGDIAKLRAAWSSYRFGVVLDQGLLLALEDEARWAIRNRLSDRSDMPNYLDFIYLDGLQSVTPAAVTIIH
ncbi:ABC transporter substrate-binding protein [Oxalobacteraceae bacterium]|nr:ABC transporter substrate-binding protein [Oxalobacteraceae bacterium]